MREDRQDRGRVSRRSSTGFRHDADKGPEREGIRWFEDEEEEYRDIRSRREDRHDEKERERDRREDRRGDAYGPRDRDRRYDDRRDDDRRDDGRRYRGGRDDDRRYDDRRDDYRGYDDRRDDYRREDDRRYRDGRYDGRRDDRRESSRTERGAKPRNTARKTSTSRTRARGGDTERFVHQIVPYAMFWVALFAAVSFILRDLCGLDGSTGAFGNWLADLLCGLFGIGAYLLPLFLVVLSLRWKKFVAEGLLTRKLVLSASFLLLLSGIVHVFVEGGATRKVLDTTAGILYANGVTRTGGGFFGGFVGEWLGYVMRLWGTILLAIPLLVVLGIYLVGLTPTDLWQRISCKFKMMGDRRRARENARYDGKEERSLRTPKKSTALPRSETAGVTAPKTEDRRRYTFREEEEDVTAELREREAAEKARKEAEKAPEPTPEVIDIPDDEIEPEGMPEDDADVILNRASERADSARDINEILREMMEQVHAVSTPAPATAPAPTPASRPEKAEGAEDTEELRGSYYAPFALPVRPEPKRDRGEASESRIVITPRDGGEAPAEPVAAEAVSEEEIGVAPNTAELPPFFEVPVAEEAAEVQPLSPTAIAPDNALAEDGDDLNAPFDEPELPPVGERVTFERAAAEAPSAPLARQVEESRSHFSFAAAFEPVEEDAIPDTVPFARDRVEDAMPESTPEWREPVRPAAVPPRPVAARVEPVRDDPVPAAEPLPRRDYQHPPISLLNEDRNVRSDDFYEEIEETKQTLRETLASFNIHIQDEVACSHGPSVTRYELRPVAGTSVRSVINRIDDISLNLAASVRIEAPIPGKPAIGIEVPNKVRETVYMRTMLESPAFQGSEKPLEVPLGLDVGGEVRMCDLAAMPHLLIAGTTGSGKSVCINSILVSLIYKTSPEDLRLILIDPKQIEFAPYEHVPHLYMPIVTDMQRAAGALACAVQEMERRFSLIRDVGVRDIEAYNKAVKNDPEREHLPRMVIVIDEFADLKMSCTNNDPENFTCRLAQKARAAGIHLIIGTQRPSVDVITGKLKTNIASRIAFMVKQQVDSRTILDINGAEALTGKGDMLYMPTNSTEKQPCRIQGAFVSDGELERVVSYVRNHNDPVQYNQAFMDQIEVEMARAANAGRKSDDYDGEEGDEFGEDPKFREAVELAIETQKVATSLLQRRLGVGYGRAAKIIDRMEMLGYVSAPEGNKARKVLITHQEYMTRLMNGEEGLEGYDE